MSTVDGGPAEPDGRFGIESQIWVIQKRQLVRPGRGTLCLQVEENAPYSYQGRVLGFFWGVSLARADALLDEKVGW